MQQLSKEYRQQVANKLVAILEQSGYVNHITLRYYDLTEKIYLKIKMDQIDDLMTDFQWFRLGRKIGVATGERRWNIARTDVYDCIEQDVIFCQENSKAMICVDECGIGKTFAAKHLAATRPNCFYVDASQAKSAYLFTRALGKALGVSTSGKYTSVKDDIKAFLNMINRPMVIVDEAGDLGQLIIQELKEYWNATEGFCGWYLIGADGLRYVIEKGIKNRRPGFKEVFSRFSDNFSTIVPKGKEDRLSFYKKLITDVLMVNVKNEKNIDDIVRRCLVFDANGSISGLRRAESLMILFEKDEKTETITIPA